MSNLKGKFTRLSDNGRFLLETCKVEGKYNNDGEVIENCLALHAIFLGVETKRARESLYQSLVASAENARDTARLARVAVHRPHPEPLLRARKARSVAKTPAGGGVVPSLE